MDVTAAAIAVGLVLALRVQLGVDAESVVAVVGNEHQGGVRVATELVNFHQIGATRKQGYSLPVLPVPSSVEVPASPELSEEASSPDGLEVLPPASNVKFLPASRFTILLSHDVLFRCLPFPSKLNSVFIFIR